MGNLFSQEEQAPKWKKEWKGMPEFIQLDKRPCQKIVVNFETHADVKEFAKLLGFRATSKTNSIWFPPKINDKPREYAYVDGNE